MIWRLVNCVMITSFGRIGETIFLFVPTVTTVACDHKKILMGCGEPMMKCSSVCRADMIPQSSRCKVDIFCPSFVNTRELKETMRFPVGNSFTKMDPVPMLDEST